MSRSFDLEQRGPSGVSATMNTIDRFKVQARFALILGIGAWIFGWLIVYHLWTHPDPLIQQSLGHPVIDQVLVLSVYVFALGLGPIGTLFYSYTITVVGSHITVRQLFGLRTRIYSMTELDRYSSKPVGETQKLSMHFTDGSSVTVDSWAHNFRRLVQYLDEVNH
jgi:hypothetical protein